MLYRPAEQSIMRLSSLGIRDRVEDQPMGRRLPSTLPLIEEPLGNCVNYPERLMTDKTRATNLRYLCNEIRRVLEEIPGAA